MLRARFDGKVLIPIGPVDLPTGRVLEIEVTDPAEPAPGSPLALLRAMDAPPHLTQEDVDALNRSIEEGKLPVREGGVFDETTG